MRKTLKNIELKMIYNNIIIQTLLTGVKKHSTDNCVQKSVCLLTYKKYCTVTPASIHPLVTNEKILEMKELFSFAHLQAKWTLEFYSINQGRHHPASSQRSDWDPL